LKKGRGIVRVNWPKESIGALAISLKLSLIEPSTPLVLFSSVDEYIGAIRLPAGVVLTRFQAVWEVVEEDFLVSTLDLGSALCVELNFYDVEGRYVRDGVFEVAGWGVFADICGGH